MPATIGYRPLPGGVATRSRACDAPAFGQFTQTLAGNVSNAQFYVALVEARDIEKGESAVQAPPTSPDTTTTAFVGPRRMFLPRRGADRLHHHQPGGTDCRGRHTFMAASTAPKKKTQPKPKSEKTVPRTAEERHADNVTRFDEYRARARNLKASPAGKAIPPYVVSAAELDDGIDSDVVLVPPTTLADPTALDRAIRASDLVAIVVILWSRCRAPHRSPATALRRPRQVPSPSPRPDLPDAVPLGKRRGSGMGVGRNMQVRRVSRRYTP
jgi:hypothetical protein